MRIYIYMNRVILSTISILIINNQGVQITGYDPLLSNDRGIFTEPSRYLTTIRDTHTDTQTDERNLLIRPLRWAQVPRYTYQVS
jgi:hypothetical protein